MASKFVWYELMTSNALAAETFYRDVVGWSARDAGMPDFKYILLSAGETMVAGLVQFPADAAQAQAQPAWFGYIGVDDVDAKADEAVKLGAKLHHAPTDIPNNIGRFAVLSDPQGAFFSLFKPNGTPPTPPPPPMTPGTIGWHELHTSNAQKAFDFYSTLFGWQQTGAMDMGPIGTYHLFGDESSPMGLGGMFNDPEAPHPYWLYYFATADIDSAMERVKAAGGKIIREPTQVPGGAWIIHGRDPQGAVFALVGMREANAAA
jgi:predicted enzyme related to lactoylglutathione lyase